MVREKFPVRLTPEDRDQLEHTVRSGRSPARVTTRAPILLTTDEGWPASRVVQARDVAECTVFRVKRGFAEEGLAGVIQNRPQAKRSRKLDDRGEAHLIALACSPAPEGHERFLNLSLCTFLVFQCLAGIGGPFSYPALSQSVGRLPAAPCYGPWGLCSRFPANGAASGRVSGPRLLLRRGRPTAVSGQGQIALYLHRPVRRRGYSAQGYPGLTDHRSAW